jgi:ribose transport system permease protein
VSQQPQSFAAAPPHSDANASGAVAASAGAAPSGRSLVIRLAPYALPTVFLLFIVGFAAHLGGLFFSVSDFSSIGLTQSVLVVVSLAELFVLVSGEFDLSVGGNLGLAAILVTGLPSKEGLGLGLSVVLSLLATTAVGILNGWLVNVVRVNAFIATLSTGLILGGVTVWYTNSQTIYTGIPQALPHFGTAALAGVPYPILLFVVLTAVVWYVLDRTPYGRFLYAIGGSRDASRLAGLNVKVLSISAFAVSGLLSGVAGCLESAVIGSGNPTVGPDFLLPAFTTVFLGATAFTVGRYNVFGTLLAVFTIAVGVAGLELSGVPYYIEPIFDGILLIIAVAATRRLRRDLA